MLTEHSVAEAAVAAGLPAGPGRAAFVEATGSTNTDLLAMAASGAPAWTVLVAGHQGAGRGRLGRSWEAPAGSSLLVSVLLDPGPDPSLVPLASFAAAVAMIDALSVVCGVSATSKWPNDVLAGERKLGGILAEARFEGGRAGHLIVGAGVNVTQGGGDLPADVRAEATSVVLQGGRPDLPGLLTAYLRGLRALHRPNDPGWANEVLGRYRARCSTVGRQVRAVTGDGEAVVGRAIGVGPRGELIVVDAGDVRRAITFGEVVHVRPLGGDDAGGLTEPAG